MKKADVVIVGGGPVGLWVATQIKKRRPHLGVHVHERYQQYERSHVLRLEHASMQIYSKLKNDAAEKDFFRAVTGKTPREIFQTAAIGHVNIRTNDLEGALTSYAKTLGVNIHYSTVTNPEEVEKMYPGCKTFIAADGAHSKMRTALLGEQSTKDFPLQYVVEVKYEAKGRAGELQPDDLFRTGKIMDSTPFEYVGREKNGKTPVTVRFFVDEDTYNALPQASFRAPLSLNDAEIPASLAQDIKTYMNVRAEKAGETFLEGSDKMSKLTLSLYKAKTFAVERGNGKAWYLAGDAAMGVPYFRSLNAGMLIGSQLAAIVTRGFLPTAGRVAAYNLMRPLDTAWEFTGAQIKNFGIQAYEMFKKMDAAAPMQIVKWNDAETRRFKNSKHTAFKPK
ncbi:MAG: hypothetical protein OXT65_04810 [Alphaproteobacteria bacterium]|nr:hypothetical protein [Alphaproteobacteria bacterium]